MIATNNTSTHPQDDAEAPFRKSVTLPQGRDRASRARVVTSDFSATPNPLTVHKVNNLLSHLATTVPYRPGCARVSAWRPSKIVGLESRPLLGRGSGSFNPASMRSHATAEQRGP